jgi:pyrroloquinoline quinone biosynthesis protein D
MAGDAWRGVRPRQAPDSMLTLEMRPRLAGKARLRWDRKGERYMLLYPERGLVLNGTAADVVRLCTGQLTVGAIVDQLAVKYAPQPRDAVEREVLAFLSRMAERALVTLGDD